MQRVIIVLGMHRSGTSALTGSLEGAGVYLGPVHRDEIAHNRKGLIELWSVMRLQEDLLRENDGSWFAPPERVLWSPQALAKRDEMIAGNRDHPIWGFKDPRTLFTLDGWLEAIPQAEFIGIFRHPLAVARSLMNRGLVEGGEFQSLDQAVELWVRYNRRLLNLHRELRFPLLCFDVSEAKFKSDLSDAFQDLSLPDHSAPKTFFENQLRQFKVSDEDEMPNLSVEAVTLYEELRIAAGTEELEQQE